MKNTDTHKLCEKWSPILEGINDSYVRETTAVLLENQARHVLAERSKEGLLEESTTVGQLGTFQKFAFPLVRRVFPELIANKVVGVQPMQGPVSQIFYLGFDRQAGGNTQSVYGKHLITYRGQTAQANNGNATGFPGGIDGNTMDWDTTGTGWVEGGAAPGGAGTFSGSLSGSVGEGIAAFPSSTLTQFNTSAGEAMAGGVIPEINFHIEQQAVIARTRKFRALWTIEAAQDLKAYHNLDLERELTDLLGKEVALEIDREILEDLRMIAYDVSGNNPTVNPAFNRGGLDLANPNSFPADHDWTPNTFTFDQDSGLANTNDAGGLRNVYFVDFSTTSLSLAPRHVGEVYSNLLAAVNFAAQDIYKTTYRGAGNYIITSPLVAAMLQSAAKLEGGLDSSEAGTLGAQIHYKGKWAGMYDVYVDPLWPEDEILVGYKGANAMEGGYVYSPYIPVQMLPTVINPEDFQPRKGLITRYGKSVVTPESRWYRIVRLVGADSNFLTLPFERIATTYGANL
tara:strand:- start:3574 stop:5112 length:1539 start_codon:yes stop_codon:yes gene_type:complete